MATVTPKDLRQEGGFSTSDGRLQVNISPNDLLSLGSHVVTLRVRDSSGNTGTQTLEIRVVDRGNPNAVPRLLDIETNEPIQRVDIGSSFILSGDESFDPQGSPITEYHWTLQSQLIIDPIDRPTPIDDIRPIGQ